MPEHLCLQFLPKAKWKVNNKEASLGKKVTKW